MNVLPKTYIKYKFYTVYNATLNTKKMFQFNCDKDFFLWV